MVYRSIGFFIIPGRVKNVKYYKGRERFLDMAHDYFYGRQADRFAFVKFPKAILLDPEYAKLSAEAKLLYAIFLDRMTLSVKNNWFDDENRVYIQYSRDAIMQVLSCQTGKAAKVVSELERYGLIKKEKSGLGHADRIYVLNFESDDTVTEDYREASEVMDDDRSAKIAPAEVRKSHVRKCENRTSGDSEIELQEVRKPHTNKNNNNQTENNNTDFKKTGTVNIYQETISSLSEESGEREDRLPVKKATGQDKAGVYAAAIKENVMYDSIMAYNHILDVKLENDKIDLERYDREYRSPEIVDRLIQYMADACAKTGYINIGSESVKAEVVRERFLSMERDTFEDALDKIIPRWKGLDNKKSYCVTVLYNS